VVDELRLRRAAVGGAVLLLHVLVILALLIALRTPVVRDISRVGEIVLELPPAPVTSTGPEKKNPLAIPPPKFLAPESPRAITIAPVAPSAPAPTQPQGDIRALGRYLYNCSGAYYEQLSPREKAHCLANQWNNQGPALTLGPAQPSPFDAVIARRNAPFVPAEKPCPLDHPNANLGLPCFGPGSGAPNPLNQFGH
jgi:hypothetical protein